MEAEVYFQEMGDTGFHGQEPHRVLLGFSTVLDAGNFRANIPTVFVLEELTA